MDSVVHGIGEVKVFVFDSRHSVLVLVARGGRNSKSELRNVTIVGRASLFTGGGLIGWKFARKRGYLVHNHLVFIGEFKPLGLHFGKVILPILLFVLENLGIVFLLQCDLLLQGVFSCHQFLPVVGVLHSTHLVLVVLYHGEAHLDTIYEFLFGVGFLNLLGLHHSIKHPLSGFKVVLLLCHHSKGKVGEFGLDTGFLVLCGLVHQFLQLLLLLHPLFPLNLKAIVQESKFLLQPVLHSVNDCLQSIVIVGRYFKNGIHHIAVGITNIQTSNLDSVFEVGNRLGNLLYFVPIGLPLLRGRINNLLRGRNLALQLQDSILLAHHTTSVLASQYALTNLRTFEV